MANQITSNLQLNAPLPLDNRSGVLENGVWRPYDNLAEFYLLQPEQIRFEGLAFLVKNPDDENMASLYIIGKDLEPYLYRGQKGDTGLSAYEEAVLNGFVGTEAQWLQSLKQPAIDAAIIADAATLNANNAANLANNAADNADDATQNAIIATNEALDAATVANSARGWNPILSVVNDGVLRRVLQLTGWSGGTGTTPTDFVGMYLSDTGFTSNIANANNIMGVPEISTTNMTVANRILGSDESSVPSTPKQLEMIGGWNEGNKSLSGKTSGNTGSNVSYRIVDSPQGGIYSHAGPSVTGAIRIKLPAKAQSIMYRIYGSIYTFNSIAGVVNFTIDCFANSFGTGYGATIVQNVGFFNKLQVRGYNDTIDNTKYIYIGELAQSWQYLKVNIDKVEAYYTGVTTDLVSKDWEVTIQSSFTGTLNWTVADPRPQFNPNQVMSDYVAGANTPFLNTDTLNQILGKAQSQINNRLTEAQADVLYLPRFLGNTTNAGIYIETSYLASTTRRIFYRIEKRGATSSELTFIEGQFQMNSSGGLSANHANVMGDTSPSISIFRNAGGFICLWIPTTGTNGTVLAYVCATADAKNIITNMTNVAKPSGITDEVIVTPRRTLLDNGSNANLILGDGTYQALSSLPAFTATKFATPRTINGVNFDGTANITVADSTKIPTSEKGANNGVATLDSGGKVPTGQLPTLTDNTKIPLSEKGANNGVATLGSDGKVPASQIPAIAITETFVVNSQVAMLALVAQIGDVCIRTDINKTFILSQDPATTLSNWKEMLFPTSDVTSVAGRTGAVVLSKSDVGLSNVDNTSDNDKPISSATSSALSGKLDKSGGTLTGDLLLSTSTPPNNLSAASKQFVETTVNNAIAGLKFKENVKVASTANVDIASSPASIDGVTLSNGDRILLKNQTDKTQNGIYVFNGSGSAMTRSTDADTGVKLANKTVPVDSGTVNADTWWNILEDSITIGTTEINLSKVGGEGSYSAGDQISIAGNTISVVQDATHRFVTDTEKSTWNGKATVLSNTTTISIFDAVDYLYKDVTVTGATVGMCAFTSDPLLYNSGYGKYYRLYPRVISANKVRVYIQSFYFGAGTSDAEFYDTASPNNLQDLQSGPKTITIKVI